MNPSRPFILRPVATILLMVALFLSGIVSWRLLPVSALPEVDYPTIQVVTYYPGASPEVVTSTITAPLERQLGQMPGLEQMSSSSSEGVSVINLQFSLSLTLDVAEQQVQAAINASNNLLPSDLPNPPIYNKVNPADTPILTIAVTSPTMTITKLEDLADTRIAQKLSQLPGVGLVSISGGQRPAVRVHANSKALAARNINLEQIRAAIATANVNQAKGSFNGELQSSTIDGNDQLKSAAEYEDVIISYQGGAPIRLKDVAQIFDGAENENLAAWSGREPAVILTVQRQPGANVIEVADKIKEMLPQLKNSLPAAVDVNILSDRTVTIRSSVGDVEHELVMSIALVVLVVFLFLRNMTATIIPAVAVPLSLIGTFSVMYLTGFSLNNLTLMALTIATGFVVDDAIVMIENISRFIEEGDSPMEAALKGSKQIGFTIISLTVSLIAVLIPLLFMGDVIGRLFREFAVTLAVSIILSALISLTLTPMMSARLLKPIDKEKEHKEHKFFKKINEFWDKVIEHYSTGLKWVLNHQKLTLMTTIGTVVFTGLLYIVVPKGFFPTQDSGVIQVTSEIRQSSSFNAMKTQQEKLIDIVLKDPDVENVSSFIGVDGTNPAPNNGHMQINLKPKGDRNDIRTIMSRIQENVQDIPGLTVYMQPVQDISIDSRVSYAQYQFTLQATTQQALSEWTGKLVDRLKDVPELTDVATDLQEGGLKAYININRDTASRLGVSIQDIDDALYDAFGQRLVSTIYTQTNQYRVVLQVAPEDRQSPLDIKGIYVASANGGMIPLDAIASIEEKPATLVINHMGQFPTATISFNLADGVALSKAVDLIHEVEEDMDMPDSIQTEFQGSAMAFQSSLSSTLWLILAALVTMYIVLGILYESYIHPITILSTLPSAGIGALLALMVTGKDLSVIAIIGIILLIGIVKKNAIMMIDFALTAEHEGMAPEEAIYQACLLRFRPIMMTTLAALFGAIPMMLATGIGSELRNPLGITMVGGLLVSQVLTLFTTPVIYLYFDRLARRLSKKKTQAEDEAHAS